MFELAQNVAVKAREVNGLGNYQMTKMVEELAGVEEVPDVQAWMVHTATLTTAKSHQSFSPLSLCIAAVCSGHCAWPG